MTAHCFGEQSLVDFAAAGTDCIEHATGLTDETIDTFARQQIAIVPTLVGLAVVLVAVGLAAFAVSAAGPIQFVALVVPQIAVRLAGGSRPPLLTSGLLGALLLTASDLVARTALPETFPVGVVTAVVGAPYLLWLLVRGRRRSTL